MKRFSRKLLSIGALFLFVFSSSAAYGQAELLNQILGALGQTEQDLNGQIQETQGALVNLNQEVAENQDNPENLNIIQVDIARVQDALSALQTQQATVQNAVAQTNGLYAIVNGMLADCESGDSAAAQAKAGQVVSVANSFRSIGGAGGLFGELAVQVNAIANECGAEASAQVNTNTNLSGEAGTSDDSPAPLSKPAPTSGGNENSGGNTGGSSSGTEAFEDFLEEDAQCSEEYTNELLAQKAQLDEQVAALQKQINDVQAEIDRINTKLEEGEKEKKRLADEIKKKQNQLKSLNDKLDNLNKQINDLDTQIGETEARIQELQRLLTNGGSVTSHSSGGNPLSAISSGAAISFDGGATWVVANGEGGVQDLLDAMSRNRDTIKELNKNKKALKKLNKQKKKLNKEKQKAMKDIKKLNDEIAKLQKELEAKQTECEGFEKKGINLEKALGDLKAQADELNALVAEFNEKAKECGIAARTVHYDAKKKYNRLPDDIKEQVDEAFEQEATQEEKDALNNPGEASSTPDGAATLAGGSKKLDELVDKYGACSPEGAERRDLISEQDLPTQVLRGAEKIWVHDYGGFRGLSNKQLLTDVQAAIDGLWITTSIGTQLGTQVAKGTPFEPATAYLQFVNEATTSITNVLTKWVQEGRFLGLPRWVDIAYGRFWVKQYTRNEKTHEVYICTEGVWQYSHSETSVEVTAGECVYIDDPASYKQRISVNLSKLNFRGRVDLGKAPGAFAAAIKKSLKDTVRLNNLNHIGSCPE